MIFLFEKKVNQMLPCSSLETAACKEGVGCIASEKEVSGSRGQQSEEEEEEKAQEDKRRARQGRHLQVSEAGVHNALLSLFAAGAISSRRRGKPLKCQKTYKWSASSVVF